MKLKKVYQHTTDIVGTLTKYEAGNYLAKVWSEPESGKITSITTEPNNPLMQPSIDVYENGQVILSVAELIDFPPEKVDKIIENLQHAKEVAEELRKLL